MKRKRRWLILAAVVLGAVVAGYFFIRTDGPRHGGRYDEIADIIDDNLQFGRHFTWAVNTETIKAVRPEIETQDVEVLARMLADERGTIRVAAGGLLVLLGSAGESALIRAKASDDFYARLAAQDALMHLAQCRDPTIGNLDRDVCPGR